MNTITDEQTPSVRDKSSRLALFGQRVRDLRGKRTIDEVANVLGIHRNTLYRIEKGESEPVVSAIWRMAYLFGVSAAYLLGEEDRTNQGKSDGVPPSGKAVKDGSYIYVPHFDVRAHPGMTLSAGVSCVREMHPFTREFIRQRLDIAHMDMALVDVPDQAMQPLLNEGDTVLIDTLFAQQERLVVLSEGVYALDMNGALLIRRLQWLPGKMLRVSSENPAWHSFDITPHNHDGDFSVIGRVRWAGVLL